jgi:hypothetical protein
LHKVEVSSNIDPSVGQLAGGDAMTGPDPNDQSRSGHWALVIIAWLLVGIPLLWGIWMTLQKAAALFR